MVHLRKIKRQWADHSKTSCLTNSFWSKNIFPRTIRDRDNGGLKDLFSKRSAIASTFTCSTRPIREDLSQMSFWGRSCHYQYLIVVFYIISVINKKISFFHWARVYFWPISTLSSHVFRQCNAFDLSLLKVLLRLLVPIRLAYKTAAPDWNHFS